MAWQAPRVLALLLLALALDGAALAQQAPEPPAVAAEAPALSSGTDALPPTIAKQPATAVALPVATDLAGLVTKAHPIVQAVMAVLTLSIVAVVAVFLFKIVEFSVAFRRLARSRQQLALGAVADLPAGPCPLAETARAAREELAALPPRLTADLRASARERLDLALARIEAGAVQRLRSGTGLLASIGAVAPFVGLFGTVFGIMNSFLAIAETQTTNLAVVAPGIAEALLATGIGLVAAIPAVLLYNRLLRRIGTFRHGLADGTALVLRQFSHDLDARMVLPAQGG